jgi:PAT family beta-lactamase induction signal transducer AmpG
LISHLRGYLDKDIFIIFLFGLTSGILLMLTGNTLNFWLAKTGVEIKTIGLFSLIALPYTLKYFIAPFIEHFSISNILCGQSKRKSWLIFCSVSILVLSFLLGNSDPASNIKISAILGIILAFVAVCTDITLDSYRVDISNAKNNYGISSSMFVFGYKMGMLVAGAGAIFLSTSLEWAYIYPIFGLLAFINLSVFIIFVIEDKAANYDQKKDNLQFRQIFFEPMRQFSTFREFLLVVIFIFVYKISDHFVLSMLNPFLLSLQYNEYEISFVAKTFGFLGSVFGSLLGGWLIKKYGIKNCLLYFALFHSITNILFIVQNHIGHNLVMLYILTAFGTVSGGMTMSVYISYIMSICGGKFTGTQYAFFSSLMGFSRVVLPSSSGILVEYFHWDGFFILMIVISIPGIVLSRFLPDTILNSRC